MPAIKRVLVTGATGFIGRHVMRFLDERNCESIAASLEALPLRASYPVNLLDGVSVERMMRETKPSHLIHLAWNVGDGYLENTENLDWLAASLNLLKSFAKNGGERAVFAGTCFEYDVDYGYLSESLTPLAPKTLYGMAKASLFRMAQAYAETTGISFAHGRVFYLFGECEKEGRLVPSVIRSILDGLAPEIRTPGLVRDYMYSPDVANAFVALLESDARGPVNIASGKGTEVWEIARSIARLMNFDLPLPGQRLPGVPGAPIIGSNARILQETAWRQAHSLDQGLRRTIDWWKSTGRNQTGDSGS